MTKALAQHIADNIWTSTERHLFRDAGGARLGLLQVTRWWDFTRLPGRARSHTENNKWETFRLHGTLGGHRAAYTGPDGDFVQPRHLHPVTSRAWWTYAGPLAVVFTGLADGTLVVPGLRDHGVCLFGPRVRFVPDDPTTRCRGAVQEPRSCAR